MKILIVDDSEDYLLYLHEMLAGNSYEIFSAINGAEALEKLRSGGFDMVISDIFMPVMDGFQLCRKMKEDNELKDILFIFFTATYIEEQDEVLALKMGADKFIRKSVDPNEFVKIIKEVIRRDQTGKVASRKPISEDEKEIFKLYNERLVKKLEKKVLDLEKEVIKRRQAEEQIKASLQEKETLLQEIHHRVKNNMAVIAGLLALQASNIDDSRIKEALKESQSRVYAMSAVHETLYGSENLAAIDLKSYLSKLSSTLLQTYLVDQGRVKLIIASDKIKLNIEQASPLGLIINELISNSFKYAFPNDRKGEINVSVKKLGKELEFTIMDDGVGMPDGLDWKNSSTLGLKLVRSLVENQLDGSIDMEDIGGTKFIIKFNIEA